MNDSDGLTVNPSSLTTQAADWAGYATQMRAIAAQIQSVMSLGPDEGIFSPVIKPYQQASEYLERLYSQGYAQMQVISSALLSAASTYQNTDNSLAAAIKSPQGRIQELLNGRPI